MCCGENYTAIDPEMLRMRRLSWDPTEQSEVIFFFLVWGKISFCLMGKHNMMRVTGRKQMYDPDEIEEEQRDRIARNKARHVASKMLFFRRSYSQVEWRSSGSEAAAHRKLDSKACHLLQS